MSDALAQQLSALGYTIDEENVNSRGRVLLVVSGPGLERFSMYQTEAQDLAAGRVTPDDLRASRAKVSAFKSSTS